MHTQFTKPWILLSAAFLLTCALAIRISENRLPVLAKQIHEAAWEKLAAVSRYPLNPSLPDERNAALLYQQAFEKLKIPEDACGGIFFNGNLVDSWNVNQGAETRLKTQPIGRTLYLPRAFQPFPETLRAQIDDLLAAQQEVLQLLYHAATVPEAYWKRLGEWFSRERFWGSRNSNLPRLLLYDMLVHVLDRDEPGVRRALDALAAFSRAQQYIDSVLPGYYRGMYAWCISELHIIMGYGIEKGVFSDAFLAYAADLFQYREFPLECILRDVLYDIKYMAEENKKFWMNRGKNVQTRLSMKFGPGLLWYFNRGCALSSHRGLLINQHIQQQLFDAGAETDLRELNRVLDYMDYTQYVYGSRLFWDPFGNNEPLDYDYLYSLLWRVKSEIYTMKGRARIEFILAAERFRRDTGSFPERMEQLAPKYLSAFALDLFHALNYRYVRTDAGWAMTLFSAKTGKWETQFYHPMI